MNLILPEVDTIVGLVEEISGKEIDFRVDENLYVDSLIIVARAKRISRKISFCMFQ